MKSMLIIGANGFGSHLCKDLAKYNNQIMIIDKSEERLGDLISVATSAKVGDCTNPNVLKTLGLKTFDEVFVCVDGDFQNSLEITSLVKEMGAKHVISLAGRDIQAKFLLRNGADEVVYPDKDISERVAKRTSNDRIFDYIVLTDGYGIFEISPLNEWVGKSLKELDFRAKYKMSVLGTKKESSQTPNLMPGPDHVFKKDEHIIVMAAEKDVDSLLKKNK